MGNPQRPRAEAFKPTGSAFLAITVVPGSVEVEEDGSLTLQYSAKAVAGSGENRQRVAWTGGATIDRLRLPAGTNADIENAAKAALESISGYAWRAGDRAFLFGGRTS
jgi:hypothetical protein